MPDTLTILNIETHVLLVPDVNPEAMSSSQDEFRPSPAPARSPPQPPTSLAEWVSACSQWW